MKSDSFIIILTICLLLSAGIIFAQPQSLATRVIAKPVVIQSDVNAVVQTSTLAQTLTNTAIQTTTITQKTIPIQTNTQVQTTTLTQSDSITTNTDSLIKTSNGVVEPVNTAVVTEPIVSNEVVSNEVVNKAVVPNEVVNEVPNEIIVIAYLSNAPEGIADYLKENTKELTTQIDALRREIKARYSGVADELEPQKEQVLTGLQNNDPTILAFVREVEEKHMASQPQIASLIQKLVELNQKRSEKITSLLQEKIAPSQEEARSQIEAIAGVKIISKDFMPSSFTIITTKEKIPEIESLPAVKEVVLPAKGQLMLGQSVPSILQDNFWNNSYNGNGNGSLDLDVKILDSGIWRAHLYLKDHNFSSQEAPPGCDLNDPTLIQHGTMVTGVIASTQATNKGVAFGIATANSNSDIYNAMLCPTADWSNAITLINWNISDSEVLSHSIGWGTSTGCSHNGTSYVSKDVDAKISAYPNLVWVNSAGNKYLSPAVPQPPTYPPGSICTDDDLIVWPADAYNVLSVGAMQIVGTTDRTDDRIWTTGGIIESRLGPADTPSSEKRIKPDLVAPGKSIMTTCPIGSPGCIPAVGGWMGGTGTSFSAPHVSGGALLIMDTGITDGLDVRALLLNSADDWSSAGLSYTDGPDYTYGYGYINLENAWLQKGYVEFGSLGSTSEREFFKISSFTAPTKLTMVWNQYVDGAGTRHYSNLDYTIYNENGTQVYSTTDIYDNIEQYVKIVGPEISAIVKTERASGSTPSIVDYSIASTKSIVKLTPPTYDIVINTPATITENVQFKLTVDITNSGDFMAKNVMVNLTLPSDWQIISGADPQSIGDLDAGQQKQASWTVKPGAAGSNKLIEVNVSGTNYEETFTGYASKYVDVEPGIDPLAPILINPSNNYPFVLGNTVNFVWSKAPLTNPKNFWMQVFLNGVPYTEYGSDPNKGFNMGLKTSFSITSFLIESIGIPDGIIEWRVGAEYTGDPIIHWSNKRIITKKTGADPFTPEDGKHIVVGEVFSWESITGAKNYVAKIGGLGIPGAEPYYMSLESSVPQFIITQKIYDLDIFDAGTYTWAIAGTTLKASNFLPKDQQKAFSKLSYGEERTFYKDD